MLSQQLRRVVINKNNYYPTKREKHYYNRIPMQISNQSLRKKVHQVSFSPLASQFNQQRILQRTEVY